MSNKIKTYEDWNGSGLSLSEFLYVGDRVDEDLFDFFWDVVPPIFGKRYVLLGEPSDYVDGVATHAALVLLDGDWVYAGDLSVAAARAAAERGAL